MGNLREGVGFGAHDEPVFPGYAVRERDAVLLSESAIGLHEI